MRNLQEKVKRSILLPKILLTFHILNKLLYLVISKLLQILGLQTRISKVFSQSLEQFFLTVGQNNFCNKIPFILKFPDLSLKDQIKNLVTVLTWPAIPDSHVIRAPASPVSLYEKLNPPTAFWPSIFSTAFPNFPDKLPYLVLGPVPRTFFKSIKAKDSLALSTGPDSPPIKII